MGITESKQKLEQDLNGQTETLKPSRNLTLSAEHVASDLVASKVAENIKTVPTGISIGIGGAISGGKTTLGRALELAADRDGVLCHFSPEEVNANALALYIKGQALPPKPIDNVVDSEKMRYNSCFYIVNNQVDTEESEGTKRRSNNSIPTVTISTTEAGKVNPYANPFQLFMLSTCQNRVREAHLFLKFVREFPNRKALAVVDRTAWDNSVFEEANRLLYRSISDEQHKFYSLVCESAPAFGVDALIYLDVSPEVTLKRIGIRGSSSENAYQRTYITYLHDIWFHRVVANFCETAHRCPYDSSVVIRTNRNPFPIYVVPYDEFDCEGTLQTTLENLVLSQVPRLPRVRFHERGAFRPEHPFGQNVEFNTFDWSKEYAFRNVTEKQRSNFKKQVMQLLASAKCILFLYEKK